MSDKLDGQYSVRAGQIDLSVPVLLRATADNTEVTGKVYSDITGSYWRQGGTRTAITMATLAAVDSAHADGGFKEVDATNTPGAYRFDLPDAAAAAGADWVMVYLKCSGCYGVALKFALKSKGTKDNSDVLVHGTYGLSALDTDLGTLLTRLSAVRAGYLDNLNGHTAQTGDSYAEVTSGTYGLSVIEALVDDLESRLTAARAGYLDNLNIGENVAGTSEVTSIQNNTRVVRAVQAMMERPDSGSTAFVLHIYCYDSDGNMEAPDSAPTIAVENQGGTSRNANLDSTTMTLVATGHYKSTYTVASDHAIEQLLFQFSIIEGGATRVYGNTTQIVDTTAVDFTAADRTKLEAVAADWADAGRLDAILDIIAVDVAGLDGAAMRGTDSASTHNAAAVVTAFLATTGWDSTATMTFGAAFEIIWAGIAGNIAKAADVYVHKGPDDTTTIITLTLDATSRIRS